MGINIHCTCGTSFAVDDHAIDKTIQCPNCSRAGKVPKPQAGETFDRSLPRQWCPNCKQVLTPNGRLCHPCDYLLKTGKPLKQRGPLMKVAGFALAAVAVIALWIGVALYMAASSENAAPAAPDRTADAAEDESDAASE